MWKSKELGKDLRRRTVGLHMLVQTVVHKQVIQMWHCFPSSGRRPKLLFSQERKLVWLFGNNSQTNKAQACSPLETKPRWAERVLNEKEESAPKSTLSTCSVNGTGNLHEGDGIMKKACLQILQPPQINS